MATGCDYEFARKLYRRLINCYVAILQNRTYVKNNENSHYYGPLIELSGTRKETKENGEKEGQAGKKGQQS